ncbi:hypothetical protein [Haematospirillum jordaniae]|uniref:hypothetical protein n=1 Tax=Haematospirillum jordaniae TaxID=1549855 RepID=UPI001FD79020|nr:hypothetical protein [Haematospirillum jordaniae]
MSASVPRASSSASRVAFSDSIMVSRSINAAEAVPATTWSTIRSIPVVSSFSRFCLASAPDLAVCCNRFRSAW